MSPPPSIIVDGVFIAFYVPLLALSIYNVLCHGHTKHAGFIFLSIFAAIRIMGNILLIIAYHQHYQHTGVLEWGYILQALGMSFLVSATLGFYARLHGVQAQAGKLLKGLTNTLSSSSQNGESGLAPKAHAILSLVNLVALILLIAGYTSSNDLFDNASPTGHAQSNTHSSLDTAAKAGDWVYVFLSIILLVLAVLGLKTFPSRTSNHEQKSISRFMILAIPFMVIRSVYVAIEALSSNPLNSNLAIKTILQFSTEVIVNAVYCTMGLYLSHIASQARTADREKASDVVTQTPQEGGYGSYNTYETQETY